MRLTRILILLLISLFLCGGVPLLGYSQEIPQDSYHLGLEQLEPEQQSRWLSLLSQIDTVENKDYLNEGRQIISELGELVRATKGVTPQIGDPAYDLYFSVITRLTDLLDRIQVSLVLKLPDEDLKALIELYRAEKEELNQKSRQERQKLIELGKELIKQHSQNPLYNQYPHRRLILADLYFRLAELTYQDIYERFLEENENYFYRLDSLSKVNPEEVKKLIPPVPDYSPVKVMYQRILDEYPDSPYADDALYNLAVISGESSSQREREEGNRLLETLIRLYPESEYRLNALRRIGEFYFNPPVNNLDKAEEVYKLIASEFKGTPIATEALYKLGWTYYRLNRLDDAVEHFAKALDAQGFDERVPPTGGTTLDIVNESINYICVCYALDPREWSGAGFSNLLKWLEKNPDRRERYGKRLLFQLGDIYYRSTGRYADAVEVYTELLSRYPLSEDIWKAQHNIVEIFQQGLIYDPPRAYQEKDKFFALFNPQAEWWRAHSGGQVHKDVLPLLERYLNLLIDETLALLVQDKDGQLWEKFEGYSRTYLSLWPNGPNAYKVHYDLASALEKRPGREMDALKEFWAIATNNQDTSRREIATHRILAIAQNLMKKEREGEITILPDGRIIPKKLTNPSNSPNPGNSPNNPHTDDPPDTTGNSGGSSVLPPTDLLVSEALLLSGSDLFLSLYAQSNYSPTILYQCGEILFKHNLYKEARGYLERIIKEFPNHQLISDAYGLILESHFKEGDVTGVEEVVAQIEKAAVKSELKELAKRRKAEAVFLKAAKLKDLDDHLTAAQEFFRVATENPDYQYADRSLFQAGLEWNQAHQWSKASEAFILLAERYPNSEFADKALYNAAHNYQTQLGDLSRAAVLYEKLGKTYPRSELTVGALSNASFAYNQIGDHQGAIRANELYVSLFPDAEDASVYLFENAGHFLHLGLVDRANEIYKRFAEKYPDDPRTVQAYCERGMYYKGKGDKASARREFFATIEAHQRLVGKGGKGSPKYASIALAHLLKWEQEDYEQLNLNVPSARIEEVKSRKKQWRNELVNKYQQLIQLGQKEAYQAFYLMGRMDENFAQVQAALENPPGRTIQERQEALAKLIDEAIVLNSVAVETYRNGYENLRALLNPLNEEKGRRQKEYEEFSQLVIELQKNPQTPGISDSLVKLNNLARIVSELDSAIGEATRWADSCRHKIPQVSYRNGDYLVRLWNVTSELKSTDRDPIVRLLFRQEVLKNLLAPMTLEIVGYYGKSLLWAKDLGLASHYYLTVEKAYQSALDSLLKQYREQADIAHNRLKGYIEEYIKVLPRGADAKTPSGYYPDEMGGIILDHLEYENTILNDYLEAYKSVLDTMSKMGLPYGFGEEAHNQTLRYLLQRIEEWEVMSKEASLRHQEYARKYEETSGIEWDDASVAFEDLSRNLADYLRSLLAKAFELRQNYDLAGEAGIALLIKVLTVAPQTYGAQLGLGTRGRSIVTDSDWKVWHSLVEGFEKVDFGDYNWEKPSISSYPPSFSHPVLDSLNAKAIWVIKSFSVPTPKVEERVAPPEETEWEKREEVPPIEPIPPPVSPPGKVSEDEKEYNLWMGRDSIGVRRYWFRRHFTIDESPTGMEIYITADDDYKLFVNGTFIAQDKSEGPDWNQVDYFVITPYIHKGHNVVAVEVSEVDNTNYGFMGALVYQVVPDLEKEIAAIVKNERERAERRKVEREQWLAVVTPLPTPPVIEMPSQPSPVEQKVEIPPAPPQPEKQEIQWRRWFERKKLR